MTPEDFQRIKEKQLAAYHEMANSPPEFDFGPALPKARFPSAFVDFYATIGMDFLDDERDSFLADFGEGPEVFLFDGLFTPESITSQNGIISQSIYAPEGSVILPPLHYAVGTAFGQVEMRILINLDQSSDDYGKLYLWHLAHVPLGAVGNDKGLAFLANDLAGFRAMLSLEEDL